MSQSTLFEFHTTRPSHPLYCHQDFLEKLEANRNHPVGKRAALLLQRLAVDLRRLHYKSTRGTNRGWRRSRLGGHFGSHFYAWWAPRGAPPLKGDGSFSAAPEGSIFLRDIRHHDDHSPLPPHNVGDNYLPVTIADLREESYCPAPWTTTQSRFAKTRGVVRVLKGHPGSGKTTALLHAADTSGASRVLYITFSTDLAVLARDYFDRFCSAERTFTVLTFPAFLRQLIRNDAPAAQNAEARERFRHDITLFQRTLGPWSNEIPALYDELHAHLAGAAVPESAGRFPKAEKVRLPQQAYLQQRGRYLGPAAHTALEAALKLERNEAAPLADRYFPELSLAWRAAQVIHSGSNALNPEFLRYGCIAVDECQDLTPLEVYVILALARRLQKEHGATLLLAGDEAQTVRPTDFEWAWLNDMLHSLLATPQDFKLTTNLRSPRRIANLVNRVWDLYGHLEKQDRPSGTGYAEIDDDSPDQVLYATAPAGEDLNALLTELSRREGLAIIAFDPSALPESLRPFVLTPAEAKGLDFHSICVVDAGRQLARVADLSRDRHAEIETLHRRLAIDQLRVALSRPTERLIWIDVNPAEATLQHAQAFLAEIPGTSLPPVTLEALRKTLEEDELDVEERLQRCQQDARQLLAIKPDLAWSRAQHAVSLLGAIGQPLAVQDETVRRSAYLTLAEVSFLLGFRKVRLSPELGRRDLFSEAASAARMADRLGLSNILLEAGALQRAQAVSRASAIANLIQGVNRHRAEFEGWLVVEFTPQVDSWIRELEVHLHVNDNALLAVEMLPPFFEAMALPDAAERSRALTKRCIDVLLKNKRYSSALRILERLPQRQPKLEAECLEELKQYDKAAELYLSVGDADKALRCFRAVPDFQAALKLVKKIEAHPARESLEWLASLDAVLAKRPEKFNRVMTMPEKKLLEEMMERALGVQRKKPVKKAAAKTAVKQAPARKKAGPAPE